MTSKKFIAAIEHILFDKGAECVFLNPKDYTTHILAFSHKRYEPNTHIEHLKIGWVGTYGSFEGSESWCPPKPIYVHAEIPEGTVVGSSLPKPTEVK